MDLFGSIPPVHVVAMLVFGTLYMNASTYTQGWKHNFSATSTHTHEHTYHVHMPSGLACLPDTGLLQHGSLRGSSGPDRLCDLEGCCFQGLVPVRGGSGNAPCHQLLENVWRAERTRLWHSLHKSDRQCFKFEKQVANLSIHFYVCRSMRKRRNHFRLGVFLVFFTHTAVPEDI